MAIYGRAGNEVEILRLGTLADVKLLDKRRADAQDRKCLASNSYVVVKDKASGDERLYHLAFLRADGAIQEIMAACRAACPGVYD